MTTKIKIIEKERNGLEWIKITGVDPVSGLDFDKRGDCVFGLRDELIIDADAYPVIPGSELYHSIIRAVEDNKLIDMKS